MVILNCYYSECLEVGISAMHKDDKYYRNYWSPQIIIQEGVLVSSRKRFSSILFNILVTGGLYFWNFFRIIKVKTAYTARLLEQRAFSLTLQ
jgi:hypothetical protein